MLLLGTLLAFSSVQALAPYGAPGQGRPGVVRDDGLVVWGNGQLEVARSPFEVGAELILAGSVLGETNGGVWGLCYWISPSQEIYTVEGEVVVGDDGEPVEGVTVWGETEATCGIKIEKASQEAHSGNWVVSGTDVNQLSINLFLNTVDEISEYLRLPKDFDALHYDVGLIPQLDDSVPTTQQRFRGWSNMTLLAMETTPFLVFHSDQLSIDDFHLYDNDMTELTIWSVDFDFQRTFVRVLPSFEAGDFVKGQTYHMNVVFSADLTRGSYFNYGFYHRPCSDDTTVHCWYTQFESTTTRNAFPCLDEPGFKANFSMSVGRSKEYTSLSNNALERTTDLDPSWTGGLEDWELDVYFMTVEMSPYLVAASVHQYTGLQSETAPWHTVWAPKFEVDAGRADYAAAVGPKIMLKYQEYFNVMYPLAKMDLVYEPHKGGAMENWGHVNFCERCLLTDDFQDADSKFQTLNIIAHELAHQWFGNIVTCDWWEQTWLNEGFATYVSYIGSQYIEPEWNSWARMYVKEMQRVMHGDEDTRVHWAMTDTVTTRGDVDRKFGMFTYQKGGSVIRMMEQMFGLDTLTKGLSLYLADRSFKSSTEDDLFFHLEVAAVEDGSWPQASGPQGSLAETMKTWTNQAGLPLVHASKQCSATGCQLVFNQEWLVMTGQQTDEERRWDVPLTWYSIAKKTSRPSLPQAWIPATADSVTVEAPEILEDWPFLANLDGFGYYRVNYNSDNWALVAEVLRTDRDMISAMGRAQLICDVLALQQTGHVSSDIVSDILSYLPQETDYAPLLAHERCSLYVKGDYKDDQEELLRI